MLSYDQSTRNSLSGAPSLKEWAERFVAAFPLPATIRAFRDGNANASNPAATGTEFRKCTLTGAMTVKAGKVTKIGIIGGTTIAAAADMTSGKACVRIESGTRWVQGTLGLSAAAQIARGVPSASVVQYDFTVRGSFTAKNGLVITPNFYLQGKRTLPSGTGPAVPALTANAPYSFEVWNHTNTASPSLAGTTILNRRDDDFVYEDSELASVIGDVGIWQTTTGVLMNKHEFGFTLLVSHAGNTESGTQPLYQVLGSAVHRGDWLNYPQDPAYNSATHTNFPDPYKVVMKNQAGTVLHTFEMHDGLPINSPTLRQAVFDATNAFRPHWDSAQMLPWSNEIPKRNPLINDYYAGIEDDFTRPSIARKNHSFNGVEPYITGGYQGNNRNGLHHMYTVDKFPGPEVARDMEGPADAYLFNPNTTYPPQNHRLTGWGYEPGSFSMHNRYTGPGGVRQDRGTIASVTALYANNANYVRPQGNVSGRVWAWNFALAHFNHSQHWVTDPNTLQLASNNTELFYQWRRGREYYSNGYTPQAKQILIASDMRDGDNVAHRDYTNRFIWNGCGRDGLHNYKSAGWNSLLFTSPMHTIGNKWDSFASLLGGADWNWREGYMVRDQAWVWLQMCMAWKLASAHRLGVSRQFMEDMIAKHMAAIHRDIIVPVFDQNEQSDYAKCLRNLGSGMKKENGNSIMLGTGLGYYMGAVLVFMRQIGLMKVMRERDAICKRVIDMQIRNMDKCSLEYIATTPAGRWSYSMTVVWPETGEIPVDWPDFYTKYKDWAGYINNGDLAAGPSADLHHNGSGGLMVERDVATWPIETYILARRDYFPEFANPHVATAASKIESWKTEVRNHIAAVTTPTEKRERDYTYAWPAVAPIKAPLVLKPI